MNCAGQPKVRYFKQRVVKALGNAVEQHHRTVLISFRRYVIMIVKIRKKGGQADGNRSKAEG